MMNAFLRGFRQSWQQLGRSAWIWLATLIVFVLAFASVDALLGANVLANRVLEAARSRVDVSVSFRPSAPSAIVEQARTYLGGLAFVEKVDLVTADEALESFRGRYRGEDDVLQALKEVGRNPLGARIVVRAKRLEDYEAIVQAIHTPAYEPWIQSQSATDHAAAIRELEALRRAVRLVGSLLLALFSCVALLLAFNAVRLAVFAQSEEIRVMRLVGATQARIRLPYVFSVLWIVALAWIGVDAVGFFGYRWLAPQAGGWLGEGLDALHVAVLANGAAVLGVELGVAAILSALVAWIATGKYVKR